MRNEQYALLTGAGEVFGKALTVESARPGINLPGFFKEMLADLQLKRVKVFKNPVLGSNLRLLINLFFIDPLKSIL